MNTKQLHGLSNRSRRIPKRIREIQSELASHDRRCQCIEEDESLALQTRQAQIKKIRDLCGPLHQQLRMLNDRLAFGLGGTVQSARRMPFFVEKLRVWRLSKTESFPAADTGRRVGKCTRAYRVVTSCFARV